MPLSSQDTAITQAIARLLAASNDDRSFDAAQMQLINLPEIIQGAGEHWARAKDKIRTGSTQFLQGCLDERDIVLPAGDGFLIIFHDRADPGTLKARAHELRLSLLQFYLGEEQFRRLQLRVKTTTLSLHDLGDIIATTAPPVREEAMRWAFAPLWTPRAQMIGAYVCLPVRYEEKGRVTGYDEAYALSGVSAGRDYAQFDLDMLDAVETNVAEDTATQATAIIGASAHATTLQNRASRLAFLERLARFSPKMLQRMFIRVSEIEPGAPLVTIADWAGLPRARVKHIMLEFHHSEAGAPDLSQIGIWAAGFRLPEKVGRENADITTVLRRCGIWGASLRRQNTHFFLDDVRSSLVIGPAGDAGAQFLTGDGFWPFAGRSAGVRKVPRALDPAERSA